MPDPLRLTRRLSTTPRTVRIPARLRLRPTIGAPSASVRPVGDALVASRTDPNEAIETGMGDGAPCGRDSVAPTPRTTRRRGPRRGDPRGRPSRIQHGFVSFVRGGRPVPTRTRPSGNRHGGDDKRGDDKRGRRQASPLRIGGPVPRRSEYEPFKSAAHRCSYATQVSTSGALKDSRPAGGIERPRHHP